MMGNGHNDYNGKVDVPVEAIQIIDPAVVKRMNIHLPSPQHCRVFQFVSNEMIRASSEHRSREYYSSWRELLDSYCETRCGNG